MKNLILQSFFLTALISGFAINNLAANPDNWNSFLNNNLEWQLNLDASEETFSSSSIVALSCKPSLQISLDQDGNALITPSMLVSGPNYPLDQYTVDIMGPLTNTVSCAQIGQEVMAVLEETPTGNTCMSILIVQDKLKPVLICMGDTLPCNVDIDTINFENFIDVVEDNCDTDVDLWHSFTVTPLGCNPDNIVAFIKVNWTATDNFNNSTTCSDTIFLVRPPISEVIFPNDTTLNCVDGDPDPEVIGGPTLLGGPIDHTCKYVAFHTDNVIPMCDGQRKIIRIWTVMDWCNGESRTDMQEILIIDETPPTLVCPTNTNIPTNSNNCVADYTLVPPVSVTDDCSDDELITVEILVQGELGVFSPGDVVELGLGQTLITIRATDDCNNTSTCMYAVNVVDNIPPTAVCSNITTSVSQSGTVTILADTLQFNPFDNCGVANVQVSRMVDNCNNPSNLVFDEEVTFCCEDVGEIIMVAYKITDINGNMNTCMFEVQVKDVLPPNAICMDIQISVADGGAVIVTPNDIDNGSTDNCEIVTRDVTPNSFDCDDVGIQVVVLTVTDASGNTDTCSANVEVIDDVPPMAVCNNVTLTLNDMGMAVTTVFDIDGGSTDNCGIDTAFISKDKFTCDDIGANSIILTVQDLSGNSDTCHAIVTILEEPPTALCKNITIDLDQNGIASITAMQIDNGSSDDCGIDTITVDPRMFDCADLGANIVTLTVTDVSGNTTTCTATVTVEDNMAPMCVTQDINVYLASNGMVSIMSSDIDNGSQDNCSVTNINAEPLDFDCTNIGPNMVQFIASDAMGNMDTCQAIVTVIDSISPVCIAQDLNVFLDTNGDASITANQVNNGSSDNCTIVSIIANPTDFDCADAGNIVQVILVVTDQSTNSSSCISNVFVQDTFPPQAICMNASIMLDAMGNASIATIDINNGSGDNCDNNLDLMLSQTDFDCDDIGVQVVILTVTDDNGTMSTCSANVTISDNMDPNAICMDIIVMLDANGNATITPAQIDGGTTDNCSFVLTATPLIFDCTNVGLNNVLLTATDPSGNTDNCTAVVNVMENIPPVAVCQNITVQLGANGLVSITPDQVDGGSTDNCGDPTITATPLDFDCDDIGPNPVLLTVTDAAGNTDTCIAIVTVEDDLPPTALCMNVSISLDAAGNASITINQINNGSTDNCDDNLDFQLSQMDFDCDDVGMVNQVILTVTDNGGNSDTCQAIVTVIDDMDPNAICQNSTVTLGANGMVTITAADVDGGSNDNCTFIISAIPLTFDCDDVGPNNVILTVTDASGNTDQCTAIVTVEEDSDPNAICQNITIFLDGNGMVSITADDVDNGSTDNCGDPNLSVDPTDFDCTNVGPNTVVLTVSDNAGNSDTCQATVTVLDTISPMANCNDLEVFIDANGNGTVTLADINNNSSDNCPGLTPTIDITTFDCADVGAQIVVLTITDASNNVDTCQSVITVQDTISPTCITQNIAVNLGANGMVTITADQIDNGSTDNCPPVTLAVDPSTFDCTNAGVNIVTLTVTDQSNNTSQCTAIVTIADAAPMAMCMDATVYLNGNGLVVILPSDVDAGSGSVCGDLTSTVEPDSFYCANIGDNIVTLTVTDGVGNTSTCTATVMVLDTILPTCLTQDIDLFLDDQGAGAITVNDIDNGSSDNCDFTTSVTPTDFTCADVGAQNVILTVTDGSGNISTCDAVVTVQDTISPTCNAMDIQVSLDGNGNVMITVNDVNNGSTDNCSPITFGLTPTNFTCDNLGENVVTLTAQDPSGNVSACTAIVTVIDESNLVANCQNVTIFLDVNGVVTITPDDIDTGSGGGCIGGDVDLTLDQTDFDCGGVGVNTVTLTVTDQNNNTATCQASVTVVDNLPPDILCPANAQTTCNDIDDVNDLSDFGAPTTSDNCGVASVVETVALNLDDCGVGTIVRTFVATDDNGNTASCTQTITITNPDPFGINDITFPPDLFELDDCASTDPGDIPGSQPVIDLESGSCANVTVTFSDVLTTNVDNDPNTPCIEIVRTFRIVDSCQFMTGSTNGVFEFEQTIRIQDNTAPLFNPLPNITVTAMGGSCEAFINVTAQVTDCGMVTVTNNSSFAIQGGANASGTYPFGTTFVIFNATDQCGNMSADTVRIRVNQATPPQFMCAKIIRDLPLELVITVNAHEFVEIVPGSCSNDDNVLFSYSQNNPFDSLRVFNCSHVGVTTRTLYFFREDGVFLNSCPTADLELRDDMDFCMNGFTISGEVGNESGLAIESAEIMIEGMDMLPVLTSIDGTYSIDSLANDGNYTVTPDRNTNHKEGVSTLDMVAIQKHLLSIKPFDSPFKYIAADANNSGHVSALDLIEIRKLLLGIYTEFPSNKSWRFVDQSFDFPDPFNPWMIPFPESITLMQLEEQVTFVDFVGIKVGDINGSFFNLTNNTPVINRSSKGWVKIENKTISKDWVEVPLKVAVDQLAIGWQMAFNIDNAVEWEVVSQNEKIEETQLYSDDQGVKLSWNDIQNIQFDEDEELLVIRFRTLNGSIKLSDILYLDQEILTPELYEDGEEAIIYPISITWKDEKQGDAQMEYALFQNTPNPFNGKTNISFSLPIESDVLLKIFNVNGSEVYSEKGFYGEGTHSIELESNQFNATGIYYYTLKTDGFTATRMMLKVK